MNNIRKLLHMKDGDYIIAAWHTHEAGPGWQNHPLWVVVGTYNASRTECLQPKEWWGIKQMDPFLVRINEDAQNTIKKVLEAATKTDK